LCLGALDSPSATAVREWIDVETRHRRYNSFNLFYADRERAFVSSWNGALETLELAPGKMTLSNDHGPGELQLPEFEQLDMSRPRAELRRDLIAILGSHAPRANDFRVCKHGSVHGTVSSSLFNLDAAGQVTFEYAGGPPCRTPFLGFELQSRSRPAIPGRRV
jgi:hypothetical protein